jgi:hypothetical protein
MKQPRERDFHMNLWLFPRFIQHFHFYRQHLYLILRDPLILDECFYTNGVLTGNLSPKRFFWIDDLLFFYLSSIFPYLYSTSTWLTPEFE